ncbi:hypothetical protein QJS04_geneDACA016434 [Acorus gramineus]|uniref:Uncharacterized protein n=1 Tax=Acorus gramineus TaxID=55184 RepID=A0AAV9BD20_ACOGR|nr:hypothetical protein QJS04_geneDACA016434 [Acorus gramineus]
MSRKGKAFIEPNWASELQCKLHPFSSTVGVCAHCLTERLLKLTCSDSCLCSSPDSISAVDVGSVGRISFLIENDRGGDEEEEEEGEAEEFGVLKRSRSSVNVKSLGALWGLFGRKREVGVSCGDVSKRCSVVGFDELGVPSSSSVGSFNGGFGEAELGFDENSRKDGFFGGESYGFGGGVESKPGFGGLDGEGASVENGGGGFGGRNGSSCRFKYSESWIRGGKKRFKPWMWFLKASGVRRTRH